MWQDQNWRQDEFALLELEEYRRTLEVFWVKCEGTLVWKPWRKDWIYEHFDGRQRHTSREFATTNSLQCLGLSLGRVQLLLARELKGYQKIALPARYQQS
jgi:hypothetical protein